jgi:uncharacterized membrane-anchored protein
MWYKSENILSIHSIYISKREIFYWLTVFFTFSLGTASDVLVSEGSGLGYLFTAILISALIIVFDIGYRKGWNSVLYIMTHPLGESFEALLSQLRGAGGIGLGTTTTSMLFLVAILIDLTYLAKSKKIRLLQWMILHSTIEYNEYLIKFLYWLNLVLKLFY